MAKLEKFYEVVPSKRIEDGIKEVMYDYEDLKKDGSWLISHDYNGHIVFETYARAALCWYEKYNGRTNIFAN